MSMMLKTHPNSVFAQHVLLFDRQIQHASRTYNVTIERLAPPFTPQGRTQTDVVLLLHFSHIDITCTASHPLPPNHLPPPKLLSPSQHRPHLLITHRTLPFPHTPRKFRPRTRLLQELLRTIIRLISNLIIHRIKHLKTQPLRLQTCLHHTAQIPRISITPRMHFPILRLMYIRLEFLREFIWLDHRADSQTVNIHAFKPLREAVSYALHADFARGVDVHGFGGRGLDEGKVRDVDVAFGVGYAVGGDARGEDDGADAEFAGGFDDVLGGEYMDC